MPTLSYVHQLFSADTCQTYLGALRWKERPLQCPRCQSHVVGHWGTYHYRPGLHATGVMAVGAPLTTSPTPCSPRANGHCRIGFWLPFCCACRVSLGASPENEASISAPAIGGAGGCAMRLSPVGQPPRGCCGARPAGFYCHDGTEGRRPRRPSRQSTLYGLGE